MQNKSKNKIYKASLRVLYGDTDAAGVVYNANYLRYFEFGRTEFMRDLVCPYSKIEKMGIVLPLVESWIRYKSPARYDDLVTIETSLAELSYIKSRFEYRIVKDRQNGEERRQLIAKGYTVHVPINKKGKLMRLPEKLFEQMIPFALEIAEK